VIRLAYRDKYHTVGYCTGCGLEYGNPGQQRYGIPQKVITMVEVRRLLNEAYGTLVIHEPRLKMNVLMKCLDMAAIRMTGYGIPSIPTYRLKQWRYEIVAGYITRMDTGETEP
jgi:hypothetical protein